MTKILLDTDIGNDIDDALCLAYLLANPECELVGVTTVSGEPDKRAMMVSAIAKQADQDIPIYPGIAQPLMSEQRQPYPPQFKEVHKWQHDTVFPQNEAIEFMRKTIRDNPGEITLLAVGPLTNVAVLFAADREIPGMLKELVLMCGRFENKLPHAPLAEWNAWCDPYAAAIVYSSDAKIRSFGLDVTMQLVLEEEEVYEMFTADILKPVTDFAGVWFESGRSVTFHDPLASVAVFKPEICGYKKGDVDIELLSERVIGLTYFKENEDGNNLIATTVEKDEFFEHYFGMLNDYK